MKLNYHVAVAAVLCSAFLVGCSSSGGGSAGVTVSRVADLVAQTATITISGDPTSAGATVTVTTQAADVSLAATITGGGTATLNLTLTATNNAARLISNLKVISDSGSSTLGAATISGGTGLIGGEDYVFFGFNAVDAGASADATDTLDITVNGETADIVIQVTIPVEDAMIFVSDARTGSADSLVMQGTTGTGPDNLISGIGQFFSHISGAAGFRDGASSADGNFIFFGQRQMPHVVVYNNTTGELSTINLATNDSYGAVESVHVSADGAFVYASLLEGSHQSDFDSGGGGTSRISLVKINIATMEEVARLDLTQGGGNRIYRLSITDDGTTGAVALGASGPAHHVAVINLNSMTLDTLLDLSDGATVNPRYAAISPDGAYVYVAYNFDTNNSAGPMDVVTVADGTITPVAFTSSTTSTPRALRFDSTGRLFYVKADTADVSILTFTGADYSVPTGEIEVTLTGSPSGFDFGPYGDFYYICSGGTVHQVQISDNTEVTSFFPSDASTGPLCVVSAY